jgi:hypothetical protein
MKNTLRFYVFIPVLILIFGLFFSDTLTGGTRMTTDDNIGHLAEYKSRLPHGFLAGSWQETPLIGMPSSAWPLNWSNAWLALLPVRTFANYFHPICLLAGSLALGLYLHRKGLSTLAVLAGILVTFWLGSNFTLIYAGHIRKFAVVFLFCLNLTCIDLIFEKRRWEWAVIAGLLLGLMFTEQQDVALFFGMFLGAYTIYQWYTAGHRPRDVVYLIPLPLIALLVAAFALQSAFQQNIADSSTTDQMNENEQWAYSTQWSFPPDELIAFIAPGYTGWRSGEPDGPYWGRMGRSDNWKQTRQGFMNFKLENTYLGIIPVALALFAIAAGWPNQRRGIILFWAIATAMALLLSFGKFTPLYRLFWHLPVIHEIRNPNKFLQVFQVGAGILTAYGADLLFNHCRQNNRNPLTPFFWALTAAAGILLLLSFGSGSTGPLLADGWPAQAAQLIARNKTSALLHAAGLAAVLAGFVAVYTFKPLEKCRPLYPLWTILLLIILVADAKWLSRHYVKTLPESYIAANPVSDYLEEHLADQRVALAAQDGFYNLWLTYLFPYHEIPAFNFTQMPRMAADYKRYLSALGQNPLRLWQLSGVGILLAPAGIERQLPPAFCQKVFGFDAIPSYDGNLNVNISPNGAHGVYAVNTPAPRYALIGGAQKMTDEQALAALANPNRTPFEHIILPQDAEAPALNGSGICGTVTVQERTPEKIILQIDAREAGYLRAADKYQPDWKALLDGSPVPLLRADFISRAVYVPAGKHQVELQYWPPKRTIYFPFIAYGAGIVAVLSLIVRKHPFEFSV